MPFNKKSKKYKEKRSAMNENTEMNNGMLIKWLQVLIYIAIVSLLNSAISYLSFVPAAFTTWVSRGIMLAMVIAMFQLAPLNGRYRKAGIMRAVMLACALITAFFFGSSFLTLVASIASIISVYQEYHAHSEIIADLDRKLLGAWQSLFNWSVISAVLVSLGASIVAVILVLTNMEANASRISSITIGLLKVPQCVIEIVYMLYLRKMIALFAEGTAVR